MIRIWCAQREKIKFTEKVPCSIFSSVTWRRASFDYGLTRPMPNHSLHSSTCCRRPLATADSFSVLAAQFQISSEPLSVTWLDWLDLRPFVLKHNNASFSCPAGQMNSWERTPEWSCIWYGRIWVYSDYFLICCLQLLGPPAALSRRIFGKLWYL